MYLDLRRGVVLAQGEQHTYAVVQVLSRADPPGVALQRSQSQRVAAA